MKKYIVDCGTEGRPEFDNLNEACSFANEICNKTGIIVGVFEKEKFTQMLKEA